MFVGSGCAIDSYLDSYASDHPLCPGRRLWDPCYFIDGRLLATPSAIKPEYRPECAALTCYHDWALSRGLNCIFYHELYRPHDAPFK